MTAHQWRTLLSLGQVLEINSGTYIHCTTSTPSPECILGGILVPVPMKRVNKLLDEARIF